MPAKIREASFAASAPWRGAAVQASPYDASTDVLIEETINGCVRCRRNTLNNIVGDESLPDAILK